jgi:hypothetical protein
MDYCEPSSNVQYLYREEIKPSETRFLLREPNPYIVMSVRAAAMCIGLSIATQRCDHLIDRIEAIGR